MTPLVIEVYAPRTMLLASYAPPRREARRSPPSIRSAPNAASTTARLVDLFAQLPSKDPR